MIKKIFMGIFIATVFGLLVLGAVNRTIAKSKNREPLSLSENESERFGRVDGSQVEKQGSNDERGEGLGVGLAKVDEWLEVTGVVESVLPDLWVVTLKTGNILEIEGRTLSFLQETGFTVSEGDNLYLTGFMEADDFEVGGIENTSNGTVIAIREETGRPLWAGGRRGSRNK